MKTEAFKNWPRPLSAVDFKIFWVYPVIIGDLLRVSPNFSIRGRIIPKGGGGGNILTPQKQNIENTIGKPTELVIHVRDHRG